MADKVFCDGVRCARYEMTQLEFRRLRGELWDQSFTSTLGKAATKLYREIYREKPKLERSRVAKRNHVHRYPCGILEQAYRQLIDQGVPLVKPNSRLARPIKACEDEQPPEWTGRRAVRRAFLTKMLSK